MKISFPFSICFCSTSDTSINEAGQGENSVQAFRVFTYNELKAASNGFHSKNKIGEGGFGSVYKGQLRDGTTVAIKVLSIEIDSMRGEREFISELAALSDIKHENLVTLRGCCVDGAKRFLVYDHMENNSLAHTFLGQEQKRIKFTWAHRKKICLGIARGLAYLHEEVNPHIVHRDIKSRNILIDKDFNPKVSDFGLSRLFREDISHISTGVAGTLGYLSPEYAVSGHLTRKSDVYSYGVLVLEIISGRSVVDFHLEHGEQFLVDKMASHRYAFSVETPSLKKVVTFSFVLEHRNVVLYSGSTTTWYSRSTNLVFQEYCYMAWEMYNANNLIKLVDPVLDGDISREEAVRFLKVGLLCVQETTKLRPRMSTAIKLLANEMDVEKFNILQPGFVADLMDVKIGHKPSSKNTFSPV
ncbi:hypothetical protein LguiA_032278 [Lonicera macranthoides]